MNIAQIENNLQQLVPVINNDLFIYGLLSAYGLPKASITRLQKGNLSLSKAKGEIDWKKKLLFKEVVGADVHEIFVATIADATALKHEPRFVIVTDFTILLAYDTKTNDTLDTAIETIAKHYHFFLPWAGMEKTQHQNENIADVKAAERMAKLYDEIKKENPTNTPEEVHSLNVFLSRLLFCFFAEDTDIFLPKGLFTNSIGSHTQPDGSDLSTYLDKLFEVLNTENRNNNLAEHFNAFPYVNGGLFATQINIPIFTRKSRQAIIASGKEDWSAINPDIFGSMIQAVISPEHRGSLGMHYTSVPNIMKVIRPLFLDELYEEFEKAKHDPAKLKKLLARISKIKIFDPACGSGNFLIIAYKELRLLELKILTQLKSLASGGITGFEEKQTALFGKPQLTLAAAASSFQIPMFSCIELQNFYGIELDDFAHEIAILSLWLAQHQMNIKFKEIVGQAIPSLPLKAGGNIVQGNAIRLDWESVCPKTLDNEIYILGNPPYLGARNQDKNQKDDMAIVFRGKEEYKDSDYVLCWFLKGARFIEKINSKFAFVTTSSISQGSQIAYFWPEIFERGQEIDFAHQAFKWTNNAKDKAGIVCVIIGVQNSKSNSKRLFTSTMVRNVENITPYLTERKSIIINEAKKPISKLPLMVMGNMARDGGNLILSEVEKNSLCFNYPQSERLIRQFLGAEEYINGKIRYCLWIEDEDLELANSIPEIKTRIDKVYAFRIASKAKTTNQYSKTSHKLAQRSHQNGNSIIIPRVSSERREYIPFGFLDDRTIISDSAQAVYNTSPYLLGIISSKIHNLWVKSVGGYLGTSIRYSTSVCYNTFPFPTISVNQKNELEKYVYRILEEREHHSEKNLAQLYDPGKMPDGLREAHHQLDIAVERCYRSKPFETDEERLAYLFKLYEQMIAEEKAKNGELVFDIPTVKKAKTKVK